MATLVPFFAKVPITRQQKGNATHSSRDSYRGHYLRLRGGPSLRLTPERSPSPGPKAPTPDPLPPRAAAAAAFPSPYSFKESHRLQIQPTSPSDLFVLGFGVCLRHHKALPLAPASPASPGRAPKRPNSPRGSRWSGTRARALSFSPRALSGPRALGSLPSAPRSDPQWLFFPLLLLFTK